MDASDKMMKAALEALKDLDAYTRHLYGPGGVTGSAERLRWAIRDYLNETDKKPSQIRVEFQNKEGQTVGGCYPYPEGIARVVFALSNGAKDVRWGPIPDVES